jgi:two-component system, LytTR family, response regulator
LGRARRAAGNALPDRLGALLDRFDRHEPGPVRILVKGEGRMSFVRADEIDWIQAADNYVRIHAGRETHLVRETLSNLEGRLDPKRFARVHRSAIVNVDRIQELRSLFHGDGELRLKSGAVVSVGRTYRDRLLTTLEG